MQLIASKLKKNKKSFLKTQNVFFFVEKLVIYNSGLCSNVYLLNLGLCGRSISKSLTKKKQKNLLYILKFFWNPTWHGFWRRTNEIAIFKKLIFNVLHSQNVRMSTYYHSELSIWPFGISCAFIERVTTEYFGLPFALPYMLPHFLRTFCTIFFSYYSQHITRSVTECHLIHFQWNKYIVVHFLARYHALQSVFLKSNNILLFKKRWW